MIENEITGKKDKFIKRNSERIKFLKKVKFGLDEPVFPAKSYNFSEHGILVHSFKAFLPGTNLRLNLFVESSIIELIAEVRWVSRAKDGSGSFMGLKFAGNSENIRKVYNKESMVKSERGLEH